jgi:hypothetical protein
MFWLFLGLEIIFLIIIFFILTSILFSTFTEAPFVPTGGREMKRILEIIHINPGEVFYDLGSGDGRFVIAAAKLGAKAVGFERVWPLTIWSKLKIRLFNLSARAKIKHANFLKEDLSEADVIFCYLMPKGMNRLEPKLERELKPGARLFSRAFKLPTWQPVAIYRFGKYSPPVYEYRKK